MRSRLTELRPVPQSNVPSSWPGPGSQHPVTPLPAARQPRHRVTLAPNEGWLPLLLLALAVYSVVYSVTAAITISYNTVLWITTALGLLCGLVVAKSRYIPQTILHMGACIIGYWLALILTSSLAYHVSALSLLSSLRTVIMSGLALSGTPGSDMVFLFYLSFLCFFLGYFGSWLVYRAHLPWLVALVYVSIMIVNLNYITKRDFSFLIVILLGSLILLIARTHLAGQLAQWKSEGLYTDQSWLRLITSRFIRISALFMLLILPFSWFLPVLDQPAAGATFWNNLDNAWANITHGHLPALNNPGGLFSPYDPPGNFFGDQLTITGSVNLPNGPVLSYTSSSPLQGLYLEGFTFDQFDGHTWSSQVAHFAQPYNPNVSLPLDVPSGNYNQLQTSITILQPLDGTKHYIFAPPQPYSFSVPVTLLSDDTGTFTTTWTKTGSLARDEQYQVISEVPTATPEILSAIPLPANDVNIWAGDNNYPLLEQHYMQTPGNLSRRVLATAQQWTLGANNAYEAVLDLQTHLSNRAEFTYSLTNAPVPTNIDAVTWLLQTRQGYCTYYATAMAVMARLLRIPARVVNGFSQGHYDMEKKAWIVAGSDAHSWVQIYFPGSGWINFDPTPGFTGTNQGAPGASPTPSPTSPPVAPSPTGTTRNHPAVPQPTHTTQQDNGNTSFFPTSNSAGANFLLALSSLILLGALILLGLSIVRYRSGYKSHSTVTSIYARLCQVASMVGAPPALWQTPYEYTSALSRRFPEASGTLRRLADLFVRERWASPQHVPAPNEERDLARLWPRLRNTILRSPLKKGRRART
ncbi:MAG TPA: transglutaminase domain-containing protein [Ktedonobacteraceae bacterium]|nr:transglutaminase domain-containing protein [Ktedonobacteraceae bacterium]